MRTFCIRSIGLAALLLPLMATAAENPIDQTRLSIGLPVYVTHPDDRTGPKDWNQGWFHNEGALVDISWPVHKWSDSTVFRAGFTGGGFDNSFHKASFFAGGMAEIETFATDRLSFSLGTYAGAITGYNDSVEPSIAPYIGSAYAVTDKVELGVRGFWLPAKTIAGSDLAESDAYVGAIEIGTRF